MARSAIFWPKYERRVTPGPVYSHISIYLCKAPRMSMCKHTSTRAKANMGPLNFASSVQFQHLWTLRGFGRGHLRISAPNQFFGRLILCSRGNNPEQHGEELNRILSCNCVSARGHIQLCPLNHLPFFSYILFGYSLQITINMFWVMCKLKNSRFLRFVILKILLKNVSIFFFREKHFRKFGNHILHRGNIFL